MKNNITLLGSTGSIGRQTLEVARHLGIKVSVLCAGSNISLLEEQAREFRPAIVAVADKNKAEELRRKLKDTSISVLSGEEGVIEAASYKSSEMVVSAIMGNAGLAPNFAAIEAGLDIALANKETLVSSGELFLEKVKEKNVRLIPVDSEHSAIFQCLEGRSSNHIKRILLTASGGPFRGMNRAQLESVSASEALNHPTWSMGGKITVDSASLMNKGLEVIEAKLLFDVSEKDIQVVVHPQSIVHSAVEFDDNSVIAQLGAPDMRVPIQYALTYPNRMKSLSASVPLFEAHSLTFEKPDEENFPCLSLAYKALAMKGDATCALNGANEAAVNAFLKGDIGFCDIPVVIKKVLDSHRVALSYTLSTLIACDKASREAAEKEIECIKKERSRNK